MSSNAKGFTLIEVLIATAIMAGITAVIYSSFFSASRNVEEAETTRDSTDLARTLVMKLTDDIANAYFNPSMQETVFVGKNSGATADELRFDSITFTTLTNWRRPGSKETDLWEVGYRFEDQPDKGGKVMIRTEKRELGKDQPPPLEGGTDYTITGSVAGLRLRYYNGSAWTDEWDSRTQRTLPKAVEIQLSLDDGSTYLTKVEAGR